jgi:hypothetical protein
MMRRLQLKELEKLGPKMKGIGEIWLFFHGIVHFFFLTRVFMFLVSQSVKEVLQSLVDDNLVQMDKIGSSNCRWFRLSSPSINPGHIFNVA